MKYYQTKVELAPFIQEAAEVLMQLMADVGYESFEEVDNGFNAYIQEQSFSEKITNEIDFPFKNINITYQHNELEEKNWNEEWEKNYFQPIVINNQVIVKSTFHEVEESYPIEILIDPKMSFGTGHHETTSMMIQHILELDFEEKRVLDMGCGTGILGILASKKDAKEVIGVDIDTWCIDNSEENCQLNHISNMTIKLGNASTLEQHKPYDIILANINKNILLEDIPYYYSRLVNGGILVISGFYENDEIDLEKVTNKYSLTKLNQKVKNNWTAISYIKS